MSRLGEKIRKALRAEAAPIGFGVASTRPVSPTLLLVLRLPAERADRLSQAVKEGADAVFFEGADPSRLREKLKGGGDIPCGVRLAAGGADAVAALKEMGIDFLVLEGESSAAEALLEEEMGFVLALGGETSDAHLRVLEGLPLDALLVPSWPGPLTVRRQLELRRLYLLSRTPLLVEVPPTVTAGQLQCLRDAGVVGVILEGERAWERLADLRQAMAALPPPRRRRGREERPEAILPLTPVPPPPEEEEEEEFP